MHCTVRAVARTVLVTVLAVIGAVSLAVAPAVAAAPGEPRPVHEVETIRPTVTLTGAPPVLTCTLRHDEPGCSTSAPDTDTVLVALLYSEPWFHGAQLAVMLATDHGGCTPRTSDDEGGGDLGGPLLGLLGQIRSVETFHRCDVRLRDAFLDEVGDVTDWLDRVSDVSDLDVASFSVS